jgi:plasmid stability protein
VIAVQSLQSLTALQAGLTLMARRTPMASLTIRNLDENVKKALRIRAAERGVSMEEEARLALAAGVRGGADFRPSSSANTSAAAAAGQVKMNMTYEELRAWIDGMPKGEPLDLRYVTLDHKTLSDLISDGEL